jgi:hypothetical protein
MAVFIGSAAFSIAFRKMSESASQATCCRGRSLFVDAKRGPSANLVKVKSASALHLTMAFLSRDSGREGGQDFNRER